MKYNHIKYLVIFAFIFLIGIVNVNAESNTIDFSRKGSVTVTLTDNANNIGIKGAELTAYKVASAGLKESNLVYNNLDELKTCNTDFFVLSDVEITDEIMNCVDKSTTHRVSGVTNSSGTVTLRDLDLGIYIIVQTNKVDGYAKITPYSVLLPQSIDNAWTYDIKASPKTDITRVVNVSVKKIWNNEGNNNPDSIEIELLNGERVVDTITLSKDNNWYYEWTEIEYSDSYTVREKEVPEDYEATYRNEGYDFEVTNTYKLPLTGLELWKVELLAISGLGFIIIGLLLNRKHEEN